MEMFFCLFVKLVTKFLCRCSRMWMPPFLSEWISSGKKWHNYTEPLYYLVGATESNRIWELAPTIWFIVVLCRCAVSIGIVLMCLMCPCCWVKRRSMLFQPGPGLCWNQWKRSSEDRTGHSALSSPSFSSSARLPLIQSSDLLSIRPAIPSPQ